MLLFFIHKLLTADDQIVTQRKSLVFFAVVNKLSNHALRPTELVCASPNFSTMDSDRTPTVKLPLIILAYDTTFFPLRDNKTEKGNRHG